MTVPDDSGKGGEVPPGRKMVVLVHKTSPGADTSSPEAVCNVGPAATFEEETLGYLRKHLNSLEILKPIE